MDQITEYISPEYSYKWYFPTKGFYQFYIIMVFWEQWTGEYPSNVQQTRAEINRRETCGLYFPSKYSNFAVIHFILKTRKLRFSNPLVRSNQILEYAWLYDREIWSTWFVCPYYSKYQPTYHCTVVHCPSVHNLYSSLYK